MTLLVPRTLAATVVLGLTINTSLYATDQWNIDCSHGKCAKAITSHLSDSSHMTKQRRALPEQLQHFFSAATGWTAGSSVGLTSLIKKALATVEKNRRQEQIARAAVEFTPTKALGDSQSATVKLAQTYKGLEVVGQEAMVHFDNEGTVAQTTTNGTITAPLEVEPRLTTDQALRVLTDRYQQDVGLSNPAVLKVLQDFDGKARLVYHLLTRSTASHDGREVYLDAHTGAVVIEFDRAYHAHAVEEVEEKSAPQGGYRTVYSAATEAAQRPGRVDMGGYPTNINFAWYDKIIEDGAYNNEALDRSAVNAYRNSGKVYDYFKDNFGRKSFDDKDTRIVSVVHMGVKMANAFWTSEFNVMGYGDGDGEGLVDLTYGLDVAAHEIAHGVTGSTAQLVYAAESGALNEAFSDFFGKMVDFNENDWLIGGRIMAPKLKRRALRNMENPEEFGQPGSNDSELRKPTNVMCSRGNDNCGVHTNSGIPNRASVLVIQAIGKEKAEQLYYRVLTRHLSATSNFATMRSETVKACGLMFGADSEDCAQVDAAFAKVKM